MLTDPELIMLASRQILLTATRLHTVLNDLAWHAGTNTPPGGELITEIHNALDAHRDALDGLLAQQDAITNAARATTKDRLSINTLFKKLFPKISN